METKVLDINTEATEAGLVSLGAKKVFDGVRVVTYFKNDRDTGVPFLKLTEEGDKLKLSSQNTVSYEEVKLFVSRKEECVALLATLGYKPISEVRAKRISYELDAIDFDIDEFPGIPPFLEIDTGVPPALLQGELLCKLGLESNKKGEMFTPEIVSVYGKNYFDLYKLQ